jgi:hypothetical protein
MSIFGLRANAGFFFLCLAVGAFILRGVSAQDPNPDRKTKNTPDEKTIRALIAQLGDNAFEKREAADKQLAAIGLPALELLRKTAADGTDLEARERAAKLVEQIRPFRNSVKVGPIRGCGRRLPLPPRVGQVAYQNTWQAAPHGRRTGRRGD